MREQLVSDFVPDGYGIIESPNWLYKLKDRKRKVTTANIELRSGEHVWVCGIRERRFFYHTITEEDNVEQLKQLINDKRLYARDPDFVPEDK